MTTTTTTSTCSQDETRRAVAEFFIKSLNVILGARIPFKHLKKQGDGEGDDGSRGESNKGNESFDLVLVNSPLKHRYHLTTLEPIVVDVLLLKKAGGPTVQSTKAPPRPPSQSLIERWVVHCVPSAQKKNNTKNDKGSKQSSKQVFSSKRLATMLSLMLRTLYSVTRLLPAFRLFQMLNNAASSSAAGFDLSYKVGSTVVEPQDSSFRKFDLKPVDTELGRMCISVNYSSVAGSVVHAVERTGSLLSNIIPDYVGECSGLNTQDAKLTRTRSNDITLVGRRSPSEAVAATTVRRSHSSPFLNNSDCDDQILCPFAADQELARMEPTSCVEGSSREAAVGAIIRALRLASPLSRTATQQLLHLPPLLVHRGHHRHYAAAVTPERTLRQAMQELESYRVVSRRSA